MRSQPPEFAVNLGRPRIEGCKRTPLHCQRQSELSFGYSHRHLLFQTTVEDMRYQLSLSKSRPLQRDSICMSPLQGPLSPWQDPVGPASPPLSARDRLGQRQASVLRSLARALCSLPRTFFSSLKNNNKQQQTTKNKKNNKKPRSSGVISTDFGTSCNLFMGRSFVLCDSGQRPLRRLPGTASWALLLRDPPLRLPARPGSWVRRPGGRNLPTVPLTSKGILFVTLKGKIPPSDSITQR